jgi:hypothetical protein
MEGGSSRHPAAAAAVHSTRKYVQSSYVMGGPWKAAQEGILQQQRCAAHGEYSGIFYY